MAVRERKAVSKATLLDIALMCEEGYTKSTISEGDWVVPEGRYCVVCGYSELFKEDPIDNRSEKYWTHITEANLEEHLVYCWVEGWL